MSGYILRGGQENITLPAAAVESLLRRGEGDAALLYLALQRFGRGVTPEELEKVLPTMSRLRLDAAERVLQELGLLPRPQTPGPEPVRSGQRRRLPADVEPPPPEDGGVYEGDAAVGPPAGGSGEPLYHRLDGHGLPAGDGGHGL